MGYCVKTILKKDNMNDFEKTFLLNADYEIKVDQEYWNIPVFIKLKIKKQLKLLMRLLKF